MTPVPSKTVSSSKSSGDKAAHPEKSAGQDARFQTAMPQIPGVAIPRTPGQKHGLKSQHLTAIVVAGLIVFCVIAFLIMRGLRPESSPATTSNQPAASASEAQVPTAPPATLPPATALPIRRNEIGTIEEFAHPWNAKKFTYFHLLDRDGSPAIAIRLPVGDGHSAASYWAILLKAPYGKCELEFIPDPKDVTQRFGFAATHAMVADPCTGTLYDPLRTGTLPNGAWARGEIVQGAGFRPPWLVELKVEDGKLIAVRAED